MPRPKLNLTEEQRQERLKEQRRKNSLAYYHRHNPSKTPRITLDNVEEMKEYINKRRDYFKKYYEENKERLIKKSTDWKRNRGLAITTIEDPDVLHTLSMLCD
jgi:membrane peptidoglycan carboxypeptidase